MCHPVTKQSKQWNNLYWRQWECDSSGQTFPLKLIFSENCYCFSRDPFVGDTPLTLTLSTAHRCLEEKNHWNVSGILTLKKCNPKRKRKTPQKNKQTFCLFIQEGTPERPFIGSPVSNHRELTIITSVLADGQLSARHNKLMFGHRHNAVHFSWNVWDRFRVDSESWVEPSERV